MKPGTRAGITVTGRVQGVGYRFWALNHARDLDLSGFVRNCADGSVYLEVEGDPDNVRCMIDLCHNGPVHSHVAEITVTFLPIHETEGFIIR
jgi:acylphosphatase